MEKEQKQELGWRVSVLSIPAFHHCEPLFMCCMYTVYSGMQEWVIQIPSIPILVSVLFPSLHLKYFRINFLLLVQNRCVGISCFCFPLAGFQAAAAVLTACSPVIASGNATHTPGIVGELLFF